MTSKEQRFSNSQASFPAQEETPARCSVWTFISLPLICSQQRKPMYNGQDAFNMPKLAVPPISKLSSFPSEYPPIDRSIDGCMDISIDASIDRSSSWRVQYGKAFMEFMEEFYERKILHESFLAPGSVLMIYRRRTIVSSCFSYQQWEIIRSSSLKNASKLS